MYSFVTSSGGSGATQVCWLLAPTTYLGHVQLLRKIGMHRLTPWILTSVCLGPAYCCLYAGAVPHMEDFTADKADSQLLAQNIPLRLHMVVAKETVL